MHFYNHHIGDFIRDTSNLNDHQLATYLRMIWAYYQTEKPLPSDIEGIAFAMRSDEKTVHLLLRHYFTETSDGWTHSRCDREIAIYRSKKAKAKESADARWERERLMRMESERNANEMRPHQKTDANASISDANHKPLTISKEIDTPASPDAPIKPKGAKSSRKRPQVPAPPEFVSGEFSPEFTAWAKAEGFDRAHSNNARKRMLLWANSSGTKFVDWEARLKLWLMDDRKRSPAIERSATAPAM